MTTNAFNMGAANAVNNGTFGGASVNDGGSPTTVGGGLPVVVFDGTPQFGLIDKGAVLNQHQVQLWFWNNGGAFVFEVRQAYVPNGRVVRSCVLDSGSDADETVAREHAKTSFARNK